MSDKKSLRDEVQEKTVALVTKGLEEGEMSEERARAIAQMILEKIPEGISDKELMNVLPKLDDEFKELADVVMPIITEYELKVRKAVEQKVLKLVRQKKFKQALKLTRQGIEYTSKLVN